MPLKLRYILIVNFVILATMAVFFIVDDYRLQKSHTEAVLLGTKAGIQARGIADRIHTNIQDVADPKNIIPKLQSGLADMRADSELPKTVLDIRVTVHIEKPLIVASLSKMAENYYADNERFPLMRLTSQEYTELRKAIENFTSVTQSIVVGMVRYNDKLATRLLIPYTVDADVPPGPEAGLAGYNVSIGLIEILIDSSDVPIYWRSFRRMHLLFVVLFAATVTILIEVTTDRMVLRPLERLTDIIRQAEQGVVETGVVFPKNEVGRVSATLTRMLATMRRLHDERVAALERLASGVAHEIRNPLHAISMSAQYLQDLLTSEEITPEQRREAQEILDMIRTEVKELNRITNQFLSLTRPTRMEWEQRDLNDLIEKILAEFALPMRERRVELHFEPAPEPVPIAMDVVRLRTAFYNLLRNALDAMPNGGKLYVTIRPEATSVAVEIRDTGRGMSRETLERVFDPYFTTREKEGGMGLGLTLTQNAVHAHHGEITVRSRPGTGTVFTVRLPYRADLGERVGKAE